MVAVHWRKLLTCDLTVFYDWRRSQTKLTVCTAATGWTLARFLTPQLRAVEFCCTAKWQSYGIILWDGHHIQDRKRSISFSVKIPKSCDLPALAVLHVGVRSRLQQGICDLCHACHNFCRVFLRAERADQVERCLHRAHCGCIHLSRVPNQKDGGKLVPWRRGRRNILKQGQAYCWPIHSRLCKGKEINLRPTESPCAPLWMALCRRLQPLWSTMSTSALLLTRVVAILSSLRERARSSARSPLLSNSLSLAGSWRHWTKSVNQNNNYKWTKLPPLFSWFGWETNLGVHFN